MKGESFRMKDLEYFSIHGSQEDEESYKVAPTPGKKRVPICSTTEDEILTEVVERDPVKVTTAMEDTGNNDLEGDNLATGKGNIDKEILAAMSNSLAERDETSGESFLLEDLKAMKAEAWAKKKARRLRKLQKRVQFNQETEEIGSSLTFQRNCYSCIRKNQNGIGESWRCEIHTIGFHPNWERHFHPFTTSHTNTSNFRASVKLNSINMFQNIIPKTAFQINSNNKM